MQMPLLLAQANELRARLRAKIRPRSWSAIGLGLLPEFHFGFAISFHVIANHLVVCTSAGVPAARDSLLFPGQPLSVGKGA